MNYYPCLAYANIQILETVNREKSKRAHARAMFGYKFAVAKKYFVEIFSKSVNKSKIQALSKQVLEGNGVVD